MTLLHSRGLEAERSLEHISQWYVGDAFDGHIQLIWGVAVPSVIDASPPSAL